MRSIDEIVADGVRRSAFSNHTMFEIWAVDWCWAPCAHDDDAAERYCPILTAAVTGVIPQEWLKETPEDKAVAGDYICTEFQPAPEVDDDEEDESQERDDPPTVLPGQIDIFGEEAA